MPQSDPYVQYTEYEDGSADFTISFADDDYRFSISPEGDIGDVVFEETLTYRGRIETNRPDERIYKELMQSDEMTEYLESSGLSRVRRADT